MNKPFPLCMVACIIFFLNNSCPLHGQTPDWSSQVANIIYSHCATCHHPGSIAPFSLLSYSDAVDHGFSIQADVNASIMPPWPPDPNYSHFRDEKVLSEQEINAINEWVDGGMPAGNLSEAPAPPVFNTNTMMEVIDDTIVLPHYTIEQDSDEYRTFVVHSDYTETKYLSEVEFMPGDPSVVHHAFILQDTSDISFSKDTATVKPGFAGGGLGGFGKYAVLFCGYIPGTDVIRLPANMGFEVPAGADYVISIHYAPGSVGKTDSSKLHVRFTNVPGVRSVANQRLLYWHKPCLINGPLFIPANEIKTFYEKSEPFTVDKSLIAIQPHSHLIAKSWKVYMVAAPGDTTNLIYIPNWNFYWQYNYFFTKVIRLPAGGCIIAEATFDNTIYNPFNPSNPPADVEAGESTFDEMMGCRFSMLDYQPGDENIIIDSSFYSSTQDVSTPPRELPLEVFPNPVHNHFEVMATLPEHAVSWTLFNCNGQQVRNGKKDLVPKGIWHQDIEVKGQPPVCIYL